MARFTVVLPDSVVGWMKKSARNEGVSQSAFVSNMLSYAMAGIERDIRILDLEDSTEDNQEILEEPDKAKKYACYHCGMTLVFNHQSRLGNQGFWIHENHGTSLCEVFATPSNLVITD